MTIYVIHATINMDKAVFAEGELAQFLQQVEARSGLKCEQLGKVVGMSGRTLRDWKREKFHPPQNVILELSRMTGVPVPDHTTLPQYWYVKKGGYISGKKYFAKYGTLGTRADRQKGGRQSWLKRRATQELWEQYTNTFQKPEESQDLAEFFGILLGDGSLNRFQCRIYLSSKPDDDYAHYIVGLITRLFSYKASLIKSRREKMFTIMISGVNFINFLCSKGLHIGNKVKQQVSVPPWISSNTEFAKACIRGLIDTDGCFAIHRYSVNGKKYSYPKIVFSNRSLPLLEFVYAGLEHLGFNPKKSAKYQVWLHNQREVQRYMREIGSRNCKKINFNSIINMLGEVGEWLKPMVC